MYFRNLIIYRLQPETIAAILADSNDFDSKLQQNPAKPVASNALRSRGWVKVYPDQPGELFGWYSGDAIGLRMGGEDRVFPATAVKLELDKRIAKAEEASGEKLSSMQRQELRHETVEELLPRTLVKPYGLSAYIDLKYHLLVVNTSSPKQAEDLVSLLRITLGSFPAHPLSSYNPPRVVLTGMLSGRTWQGINIDSYGLDLGDEYLLQEPGEEGGVIRAQRQAIESGEHQEFLSAGYQCTRLGLVQSNFDVRFTVGEDLVIRKVTFPDAPLDAENDSLEDELDARFTLMVGNTREVFDSLNACFNFARVEV